MGSEKSKSKKFGAIVGVLVIVAIGFIFIGRHGDRKELNAEMKAKTQEGSVAVATNDPEQVVPLVTLQDMKLPEVPFMVNWCEGDNCDNYVSNEIVCNADLHRNANPHSKLVGAVKPGQVVAERTLFTKILKVGSVRIDADHLGVLLTDAGEGNWNIFQDGKWDVLDLDSKEKLDAKVVSYPETEAWALVKLEDGTTGFVQRVNGENGQQCPFALAQ